ncbi:MAG TPA: hypothetical protein VMT46_07665 [Anaerolineaceae bacterium]|nr:hypothetical protein [Anaerolineaceae bacterium]
MHPGPGLHEQLAAERRLTIQETFRRLDRLERDAAQQAGWLLLADGLLLLGTAILVAGAPGAGTALRAFAWVGLVLAAYISALILVLSMGFALYTLTGRNLLSGIFLPPPPKTGKVDFDAAEADSLETAQDFGQESRAASQEELIQGTLEAVTRQRGSLARQAGALRFCRFFMLLALIAWLVGLAFRLAGLF